MNSTKDTLEEIQKLFPGVKITIDPSLDNDKGIGNPKKLADMKKVLSTIKYPLPVR